MEEPSAVVDAHLSFIAGCEVVQMKGEAPIALVVEDDPIIRMDAVEILQVAGFRTLDCSSADHAIPLLIAHERQITLVFTDVEMPGSMNGFALARHIHATWPEIGVLVASGRVHPAPGELPEAAIFIRKPFSANVVHTRMKDLLPEGQRPEPLKSLPEHR